MKTQLKFFELLVCLLFLCNCSITKLDYAKNEELPVDIDATPNVTRASFSGPNQKPFIGVAISGGGSRAANFGWASLAELSKMGILQHVDTISSVSGGSLPAAVFGLHAENLKNQADWEKYKEILAEDFLTKWLISLMNPFNWFRLTTTDYDRTQILSEVFDATLFRGATYANLMKGENQKFPRILINATSSNNPEGVFPFTFSDETFRFSLNSRIDSYPIAEAVSASGAFPGVFGNITLNKFKDQLLDYKTGKYKSITSYERLYDGGASDNLGAWALISRARNALVESKKIAGTNEGCLFILIDANAPNFSGQLKAILPDVDRSAIDLIVKNTAWDSIDSLLQINRLRTLQALGSRPSYYGRIDSEQVTTPFPLFITDTKKAVVYEMIRSNYDPIFSFKLFSPQLPYQDNILETEKEEIAELRDTECLVWHLTFERLRSMVDYVLSDGVRITTKVDKYEPVEGMDKLREFMLSDYNSDEVKTQLTPIGSLRGGLWAFDTNISTSYKLTGPEDCPVQLLQDSLFLTAKILIEEDEASRNKICEWLKSKNLQNSCPAPGPSSTWESIDPRLRENAKVLLAKTISKSELPIVTCSKTKFQQFNQQIDRANVYHNDVYTR